MVAPQIINNKLPIRHNITRKNGKLTKELKKQPGIRNFRKLHEYLNVITQQQSTPNKKPITVTRTIVNLPKPVTVTRSNNKNKNKNKRFAITLNQAKLVKITNFPGTKGETATIIPAKQPSLSKPFKINNVRRTVNKVNLNKQRKNSLVVPEEFIIQKKRPLQRNTRTSRSLVSPINLYTGINENAAVKPYTGINENAAAKLN